MIKKNICKSKSFTYSVHQKVKTITCGLIEDGDGDGSAIVLSKEKQCIFMN